MVRSIISKIGMAKWVCETVVVVKLIRPSNNLLVTLFFPPTDIETKSTVVRLRVGAKALLVNKVHLSRIPGLSVMARALNPPSPRLIIRRLLHQQHALCKPPILDSCVCLVWSRIDLTSGWAKVMRHR
jgi:hypothetical protein